jgi:hypothetical protein
MKLSLPPKLLGKLIWVPVSSFCTCFMPYNAETGRFHPPNRLTL